MGGDGRGAQVAKLRELAQLRRDRATEGVGVQVPVAAKGGAQRLPSPPPASPPSQPLQPHQTHLPSLPTRPAPALKRQHTASMGLGPW